MRKWLVGLLAAGLCVSSAWADTVTYTVKSKTEVEVSSGTAPEGATAEYVATANNVCQITSNNTATLTLKGYSGATITGLTLSMKSNASKGKGSLSVTSGDALIASIEDSNFNSENWYGAWSTEYVDVKPSVTATAIDDDVVILISGTVNSLYCQSYTIEYELGEPQFSVTFDKENWFKVALGQASSVTAIPKNGIEPYTFLWDSDTPELKGGTTDTLEIPATLAEGDYTVACLVTEDNGEGDAINALIGFTVEAVPVITGGSATYTVKTKSSVEASGDVPTGSSAAYAQTANNAGQITSNNTATLTLSGYTGMTITGLTLSMKSNASKGAGSLSVTCGDAIIASIEDSKFNTANWNGDWSTEYVDIKPAVNATAVDGDVVITIAASENSLYCQSYTVQFEAGDPQFSVTFDKENWFQVPLGEASSVTAIPKNGIEPYTFLWDSDTPALAGGKTDTLEIPATLAEGDYTVACLVTEDNGAGDAINALIGFKVVAPAVKYPITVAEGIVNGSVSVDKAEAEEGETVTVTATPETGYALEAITVNGIAISATTFPMPAEPVEVGATFAEVRDYAELPFVAEDTPYSGPWKGATVDGLTSKGLGTDYGDGAAKLDSTGDWLQVKFAGTPGTLSYGIKGNSVSADNPSTFLVQESADGETWSTLATYVSGDNLGDKTEASHELSASSQFVRFFYETKGAGNVGIYDVYITSGGPAVFSITLDPATDFDVEQNAEAFVTATPKHAEGIVGYAWWIDGTPVDTDGNVLALATGELGQHKVICEATDGAGATANAHVIYTVVEPAVKYQVQVAVGIPNGSVAADKAEAEEGELVTLSSTPEAGYKLATYLVDGEPINGNSFNMPAHDVEVSARFEEKPPVTGDVLTNDDVGSQSSSYVEWTATKESGAEYAGQSAGGSKDNPCIQLRSSNNNSGIVMTKSSGSDIASVTVEWNDATSDGRKISIYGSANPYTSPADLYDASTQGTLLGTLEKGTTTLEVPEGYAYIGIRSSSGALYLTSVAIEFGGASAPSIAYTGETEVTLPDGAFSIAFTLKNYVGAYGWTLAGEGSLSDDGVYTWTPSEPGDYTIKVSAVNEEELIADKELTLKVNAPVVKYQIACAIGIPNGSVSADKTEAEEGELVTLTASPAAGYKLEHFLVNDIAISANTFPMPAEDVLVSASFVEITGDQFTLVTSLDDLEDGAEYVITDNSQAYAMKAELSTTSTKRLLNEPVAPVEGVITTDDAAIVWKLVEDEDGNFALYNESIGKYIGWSSGNSAKFQDDAFANTISYEDNLFVVMATSTAELEKPRKLQFNSAANALQFAYYEGSQKNLCFFKKSGGPGPQPGEPAIVFGGDSEGTVGTPVNFTVTAVNVSDPQVYFDTIVTAPDDSDVTVDDIICNFPDVSFIPDCAGEYTFKFVAGVPETSDYAEGTWTVTVTGEGPGPQPGEAGITKMTIAAGKMTIEFFGEGAQVLVSDDLETWTPVNGAVSPYTIEMGDGPQYIGVR